MKSTSRKKRWRRALASGLLVMLVLAAHRDASDPSSHDAAPASPHVIAPAPPQDTSSDAIDPAPSIGSEEQSAEPSGGDVQSSDVLPEDSSSSDSSVTPDSSGLGDASGATNSSESHDSSGTTDDTHANDPTPGYLDPGETNEMCAGGAVCDPTTGLPDFVPGGGLQLPSD